MIWLVGAVHLDNSACLTLLRFYGGTRLRQASYETLRMNLSRPRRTNLCNKYSVSTPFIVNFGVFWMQKIGHCQLLVVFGTAQNQYNTKTDT